MRLGRRLRWLIFALLLYLAFCLIGGVYLADGALRPARRNLTEEETAGFQQWVRAMGAKLEDVSITTRDAPVLRGWVVQPAHPNGDAAVLSSRPWR